MYEVVSYIHTKKNNNSYSYSIKEKKKRKRKRKHLYTTYTLTTAGDTKMDFYERKKQALKTIKNLATKGETIEDIEFYIYEHFGFGSKLVKTYYEQLKARGFIK